MNKPLINSLNFYSDEPVFFKAVDIFNIRNEMYQDFENFNIYLIAKAKKIWFPPDSIRILDKNQFTFDVAIQNGYRHILQQIISPIKKEVGKIYASEFPHHSLFMENKKGKIIHEFTTFDAFRKLPKSLIPDFEVLYVGRSIGVKNKRNILDRLTKDAHEKFLKICLDVSANAPGMEVYIFALKFQYTKTHLFSNPNFDYDTPEFNISENLNYEMTKVIPRNLKIKLIEEALINYFKTTKYNQLLISSLDDQKSKAFGLLKDRGITNLFVEFNMMESQVNLFSEAVPPKKLFLFPILNLNGKIDDNMLHNTYKNWNRKENLDYLLDLD